MEKTIEESKQGQATIIKKNNSFSKKLYLESYGCQMNFSDSEIVASILANEGFETTRQLEDSDLILLNTCSIREKAEQTVRTRLRSFNKLKKRKSHLIVGMLGCMAERMKSTLLEEEKLVDLVVGPDAYRDLPRLIEEVEGGQKSVNVLLSREETYADISPVRLDKNGISGFISIMRGCDNMCTFCVVPFTRGRERSRNPLTIVAEARDLYNKGYKEVTLLGQNVDSYRWNISKKGDIIDENTSTTNFAQLLALVAKVAPDLRVRFSTSHPKDMTDEVLRTIASHKNICNYIHLPVQSGNSEILKKMNRGYSREWYLERIKAIKKIIPNCAISTDIITGFCGESDEQHQETISLLKEVEFDFSYMFFYSERPKTLAERKYDDDIPLSTKKSRLQEVIDLQHIHSKKKNENAIGNTFEVLIEGFSKKSNEMLSGRNDQNTKVVFPKGNAKVGEYVNVKIESCTTATLIGKII
ncbi:MAG: tRNA (N6-isopentenyl adenosine(37)-C2)-methylthiotransferase MiaB [Crocinitomicaceae bacterium]|nr:tRNA (N6-isopentenyl adenosine(37)-C2)-methylthiotransferase MiaB [Crocinitomicaceae bacterium]|tara:strand:- start:13668 stop:15080 length:1413 start_codon:yes stop_codon:yes gene_type:complete